jgi:hypothetical protein
MPSKSLSLCRRYPHDPTANRPVPGEGGYQQRHLYEVQHPPEVVCQDRHTELGPHFLQPPHQKVAVSLPPLHRSKLVFYQLLTPLHHLRSTPYTLLHLLQKPFINPACHPPPAFITRALRLERTACAGGRRIIADVPPKLDSVEAERESCARGTLICIRAPVMREIILAEAAQLPIR